MRREYRRPLFSCLCALLRLVALWEVQILGSGCSTSVSFLSGRASVIQYFPLYYPSNFVNVKFLIYQDGAQESSESDPGTKSVSGTQKRRTIFLDIDDVWRHLADTRIEFKKRCQESLEIISVTSKLLFDGFCILAFWGSRR